MASCLGDRNELPRAGFHLVAIILGLVATWLLISGAYHVEVIRERYAEMTSFTPLALIATLILSPVWVVIYFSVNRFYRGPARHCLGAISALSIVVVLALVGIWHFNEMILAGWDY